ncbi:Tautomerase/MIF superfamily [Triangularia verruculosa]|uniref:L-dopachrome isomerase n=1 Tax=Triangularia verruculosa TaxID=2587418 RepID=A0AAN6X834_9PEZI|nr:Tautomerase/MIF superfamily [Triangularia verruculosa]
MTPRRPAPGGQRELSFAERRAKDTPPSTSSPAATTGDILVRPGRKRHSKPDLAKQQSTVNFFEDAFAVTEGNTARERVHGDAIVMAEVKTNVIISDEFTFITELSYHLSTRYQRPVSSIVVTLQHGACMLFGGSFDPAYVMSIFALPSQLLPTTNKRNTALIQKHMEEAIGVVPARGFLRFVPIKEEHLACNGKTMAGEIDELEKTMYGVGLGGAKLALDEAQEAISRGMKGRKKLSVRSMANFRPSSAAGLHNPELTPPTSADEALPPIPGSPSPGSALKEKEELPQHQDQPLPRTARKKKSFVATIFGRSGSVKRPEHRSSLPVIRDSS